MNYPGLAPDRNGKKTFEFFYRGRQVNKEPYEGVLVSRAELVMQGSPTSLE